MLIIKDDFGGLDDPRFVAEWRDELDALTARAINKAFKPTAAEAMTQASRHNNAPLGAPQRSNPNVAHVSRASRRTLAAALVLVMRVGLSLHRVRGARPADGDVVFTAKRKQQRRDKAFFGPRGFVFKRSGSGRYALTLQTIRITLPEQTLAYLQRRFMHGFDRALDAGLNGPRGLLRKRGRKKAL